MNNLSLFVVLSIVAVTASISGTMITSALAQDNMTMGMDNMSMPTDNMGNMTMGMDNSTGMNMMDNATMAAN